MEGKSTPTASASSSKEFLEEPNKISENIHSVETMITPYTTVSTDTAINIETATACEGNSVKDITTVKYKDTTTPVFDETTNLSTNTKLCKNRK